jgi:leucyl/phenylalanyl-tRNA--protein transferase
MNRMARPQPPFEITPDILLRAYSIGLFPMAERAQDDQIFWVDPEERGIIPLSGLRISRSLAKVVRTDAFTIAIDRDFDAVVEGCASRGGAGGETWINARIRALYRELFEAGFAHCVACRQDGALVGGLYGVSLGAAFFGESMFHTARDASKVALVHLVARLRRADYRLLDTQFVTPHLASLGAIAVPRATYRTMLADAVERVADTSVWRENLFGAQALQLVLSSTGV